MKQILCFGDSNTYGLIPGTKERFNWDTRWTGLLDKKIRSKGYRVVEEGLCGRTTIFDDPSRLGRRGSELLSVILETHKPVDTVVLMLGTNDCKTAYNASPELIGEGIEQLLEQIKSVDSNINVLLVSPIELGNRVWEEGYDPEFSGKSVGISKRLPEIYKKIADKRNIDFLQASSYAYPSDIDREHLNEDGHKRLALAIFNKLNTVLQ